MIQKVACILLKFKLEMLEFTHSNQVKTLFQPRLRFIIAESLINLPPTSPNEKREKKSNHQLRR